MRSVVVVLPASMCAMIPMFRVSLRGCVRAMALVSSRIFPVDLPAVVCERLVRFRHLVRVVLLLHRAAAEVGRVEQLGSELLAHRLLSPLAGVFDQPPDCQ